MRGREQLLLVTNAAVIMGARWMHVAIARDGGTAGAVIATALIVAVLGSGWVLGVGRTA